MGSNQSHFFACATFCQFSPLLGLAQWVGGRDLGRRCQVRNSWVFLFSVTSGNHRPHNQKRQKKNPVNLLLFMLGHFTTGSGFLFQIVLTTYMGYSFLLQLTRWQARFFWGCQDHGPMTIVNHLIIIPRKSVDSLWVRTLNLPAILWVIGRY